WYPLTRIARPDGSCVRLRHPDGATLRVECRGQVASLTPAPRVFAALYTAIFAPGAPLRRAVDGPGDRLRLDLAPDADAEIATAWSRLANLTVPIVFVVVVLSVTSGWTIRRAARPATAIMNGLGAIEAGRLATRLGPFPWLEFDRIADAC